MTGLIGTIYYDGACGICRQEMMGLKAQDTHHQFELVDISAPGFNAALLGLDAKEVMRFLHMRDASGKLLVGVDAFAIIWKFTGHPILAFICRWPVSKPFAKVAYRIFARYRPVISQKLCPDGRCSRERV